MLVIPQAGIPPAPHSQGTRAGTAPSRTHAWFQAGPTGGAAAGGEEPVLILLVLPSSSALQGSLTAQRTPHSPFAASPDVLCPSLLV